VEHLFYTAGHSNLDLDHLIRMLAAHGATWVVDVRRFPRSRRNPHFNAEALAAALPDRGIAYSRAPGLGGFRKSPGESPNLAIEDPSFRAFADYMQTPDFDTALRAVGYLAARERPVLLCAEAVPWRCHRSLIADALTARGARVEHLLGPDRKQLHALPPWATVMGGHVTYPGPGAPRGQEDPAPHPGILK
jgi:uncharacterized protein (DUF488 family)